MTDTPLTESTHVGLPFLAAGQLVERQVFYLSPGKANLLPSVTTWLPGAADGGNL
jgi:hypothetical protein